jgi:hypothetical protein
MSFVLDERGRGRGQLLQHIGDRSRRDAEPAGQR